MAPKVIVVGLGPGAADLLTSATLDTIGRVQHRYLRTRRHPSADVMGADAVSFDDLYDSAMSLDEVYGAIADRLVREAEQHGEIVYAVPGSPAVAERSVELIRLDDRVLVDVVPALSFLDLSWTRLGVDPVSAGVRVIDGHRFAIEAAGQRGPFLVGQCDSKVVLSDVKLAIGEALEFESAPGAGLARRPLAGEAGTDGPDAGSGTGSEAGRPIAHGPGFGILGADLRIVVLQRLGLPDETITDLRWDDLDREIEPDHLTSVFIPQLAAPIAGEVQRFVELAATLRNECPWDREQTHDSLRRHLLEEAYEVLDALTLLDPAAGTGYEHLEEELGDLLFQIVFHCTLATEEGQFTLADVARRTYEKLYARHPHVFGEVPEGLAPGDTAGEVAANWEQIKKVEKGRASIFDGIPGSLPALLLALKIQKKAASLGEMGEDLPSPASWDHVVVTAQRHPGAETVGELLFAVVNLARHQGVDPEAALRTAAVKYRDHIKEMEG